MKKRNKYAIVAGIIILGGTGLFWSSWYLPVISIEGERVSYADFLKVSGAISTYESVAKGSAIAQEEVRRQAFMNLAEQRFLDIIIARTNPAIRGEAERLVENAIKETPNLDLEEAANTIYGLSAKEFKRFVLLPQAKRELVLRYFQGRDSELEGIWDNLYSTASVKVYYPGYEWEGGEILVK